MSRPSIAAYSAAGCGGCDIAMLDIHEHLLELAEAVDIVFWPTALDMKYADVEALPDGSIDACFFNGAIRTAENAEVARLLRRKSKVLIAFGACAAFGGVPGLGNLFRSTDILDRAFNTESTDADAVPPVPGDPDGTTSAVPAFETRVSSLAQVVDVDAIVPGCPPEADRVWEVCTALLTGELTGGVVGAGDRSVCDECDHPKRGTRIKRFVRTNEILPEPDWCLLEQGLVCLGPATRSGCGARCPSAAMPCRGCYGPCEGVADQGAKMVAVLGSLVDSEDEHEITAAVSKIVDPAGTLYCFALPTSLLGGSRVSREGADR